MSTLAAENAIVAHFESVFAADIAAGTVIVRALTNLESPEPPRAEAMLAKVHVFLQFPAHNERPTCIGGGSWRETGTFLVYVLVASGTGRDVVGALFKRATDSLKAGTIGGDLVEIMNLFGAAAGARFGGNWWGKATAAEYAVEDV